MRVVGRDAVWRDLRVVLLVILGQLVWSSLVLAPLLVGLSAGCFPPADVSVAWLALWVVGFVSVGGIGWRAHERLGGSFPVANFMPGVVILIGGCTVLLGMHGHWRQVADFLASRGWVSWSIGTFGMACR